MSAAGLHMNSRELNISIIDYGVIHKVSWVYFRQHVLNIAAAIANVIPLRKGTQHPRKMYSLINFELRVYAS
jgi:hypothetical protein